MGLTLPSDLFPQDIVATVTGLSGLAAGLVGTLFTIAVGILVDRFSYGPAFLIAGLMPCSQLRACYYWSALRATPQDQSCSRYDLEIRIMGSRNLMTISPFAQTLLGLACLAFPVAAPAQVDVLTHHNNRERTGVNLQETALTPANVNTRQFGMLFKRVVDDQLYAQPLVVTNVKIAGGWHDVVYVTTVNNSVYAFDANDASATAPSGMSTSELPPAYTMRTSPAPISTATWGSLARP